MSFSLIATTPREQYALAIAAVYQQVQNGLSDDEVDGEPEHPTCFELMRSCGFFFRFLARRSLQKNWDITNQRLLLETVQWLRAEGGRMEYEELKTTMQEHGWPDDRATSLAAAARESRGEQQDDDESDEGETFASPTALMQLISEHGTRLGQGILGWDVVRASHVIRLGIAAGFLDSAPIAWRELFLNARQAQIAFGSWKDLADSFLTGRAFWLAREGLDAEENDEFETATKRLLTHPQSPWVRLAWDLPLGV